MRCVIRHVIKLINETNAMANDAIKNEIFLLVNSWRNGWHDAWRAQ